VESPRRRIEPETGRPEACRRRSTERLESPGQFHARRQTRPKGPGIRSRMIVAVKTTVQWGKSGMEEPPKSCGEYFHRMVFVDGGVPRYAVISAVPAEWCGLFSSELTGQGNGARRTHRKGAPATSAFSEVSLAPVGLSFFLGSTHGLGRGLHSYAASRLLRSGSAYHPMGCADYPKRRRIRKHKVETAVGSHPCAQNAQGWGTRQALAPRARKDGAPGIWGGTYS
jgi:hypothetical protein